MGGIGARYDKVISEKTYFGVGGMWVPGNRVTEEESTTKDSYIMRAYEFNLGPVFMLTGDVNHSGVYVSPSLGYMKSEIVDYGDLKLKGSIESPQARLTMGYQNINAANNIRFAVGGGFRVIKSEDIVVKDSSGAEVLRQKSGSIGSLALDLQLGYMF